MTYSDDLYLVPLQHLMRLRNEHVDNVSPHTYIHRVYVIVSEEILQERVKEIPGVINQL